MKRLLLAALAALCIVSSSHGYTNPYILGAIGTQAAAAPTAVACSTQDTADTGTPTYTQDITCSGLGGQTPKAAIIIVSGTASSGSSAAEAKLAWWITDGTNSRALAIHSCDAQTTTDENNGTSEAGTLKIFATCSTSTSGTATFNSFITDGIRLNWTESPGSAFVLNAIFFAGDDITNVFVGDLTSAATDAGTAATTDPGFEPDIVYMATVGNGNTESMTGTTTAFGLGWGWNDTTAKNFGSRWGTQNAVTTTTTSVGIHNDITVVADFGTGFELGAHSITAYGASGFTVTSDDTAGGADQLEFLAIKTSRQVWIGGFTTPTSTGNSSITVGFQASHFEAICNYAGSVNAWNGGHDATDSGSMSIGSGESGTTDSSVGFVAEDNVTTSDTYSFAGTNIIAIRNQADGTGFVTASLNSFTATDVVLNYSAVDTGAHACIGFAIE